jgi:hypothetical protein
LRWDAVTSIGLFVAALWLYFIGLVAALDPDALKAGTASLSAAQERAIIALIAVGVGIAGIELWAMGLRHDLGKLPTVKELLGQSMDLLQYASVGDGRLWCELSGVFS